MLSSPHPFTLRQLQYIVAVADELSFGRAATRCHVSQPSLSSQLAQAEEGLGVCLFERSRKRVILTAVGRDVVERVRRLLHAADDIEQAAQRASDPHSGTIRLGVVATISPYLLPSITLPLRKVFPRLRFEWIEDRTEALLRRLDDGQVEGAIVALESKLGDVERYVIAQDPFFLVARRDHPLAASTAPVTAADLRGQEMLLLEDGHCFRDQALEVCRSASAREGEFRATSVLTLTQMIAGAGGATLVPAMALEAEAKRANLCVRPLALSGAHRTIGLIWRKGSSANEVLGSIASALRKAYPLAKVPSTRSVAPRRPRQPKGPMSRATNHLA